MADARIPLRVVLNRSTTDARRGVVRLHPVVLGVLGAGPWNALELRGSRLTGALAAAAPPDLDQSAILMDDITCANAGVDPGGTVDVARAFERPAASVSLRVPDGLAPLNPQAVRFALLGKVVFPGDRVSLLPQDFHRPGATDSLVEVDAVVLALRTAWGDRWQQVLLDVSATEPSGLVRVTMETVISWGDADSTTGSGTVLHPSERPPALEDLPGLEHEIKTLRELLELGFHRTDLLQRLGATPLLGVLVSGPPGSGKVALVEAVAAAVGAKVFRLWGPALARDAADRAANEIVSTLAQAEAMSPSVVLIEDVDAIAPREDPGPLLSVLLEVIQGAVDRRKTAVVCTTAHPEATNADLRRAGTIDLEIALSLPTKKDRLRILELQTRPVPLGSDVNLESVAARTPGFVAADLISLTREAALCAAQRAAAGGIAPADVVVTQADFEAALDVVRPSAMAGATLQIADVKLDDVGDMEPVKEQLNEAIVWPLRYPDSFERLGVEPPRGVLLFGPPGCGKTYLVKALANEAEANFLSVKGAELLSKWVGESERAVRELFRQARSASPALVFFDEIDALAPVRGQSQDSGTTDRVVAQMLTELDGVEDLASVFVLGATNRPELIDPALLRPGRLERLVYVPPPDAVARAEILRAVTRRMPLSEGLDVAGLGVRCEGYSAADLEALARAAAMIAMREDLATPHVTAAHFERAFMTVKPSLRADQVARLEQWARQMVAAG